MMSVEFSNYKRNIPNREKDLLEVRVDTTNGSVSFGMPNYYNEGHSLKLAYSNLKEYGMKLNCFDGGFVFCTTFCRSTTQVKIVEIKKL